MLTITKQNNALIVKGDGNSFYPDNGTNSYPLNSISVVIDESDMATFRSAANNDVLFSGLIQDITIEGEKVTKDNIIEKFDAVANGAQGGGGDVTQAQLDEVKAIAQDADTKADAVTSRIEGVETQMGDKQDTLVSGVNIKTINSQSILGSGDLTISGVSEEQAQEIAKIPTLETNMMGKQDTLVSGTNIKTINGNSILGEGNLVIEGGEIDLSNYYNKTEVDTKLDTKQNTLVSGTNIKTINSQSILGEGNIEITGGDVDLTNYYTKTEADGKFATITGFNEQAADISALQTSMDGKQPTLVSGTNIKTINNQSILGEGNLEITGGEVDLTNYYTKTEADGKFASKDEMTAVETSLGNKQDTLVSGTNIKTVNSQSILGEGNIEVSGVSEEQAQEIAKIPTLETELSQKANVSDVPTAQTGYTGTNKNYIYSSFGSPYAGVLSKVFPVPSADTIDIRLYNWTTDRDAPYSTEILTKATKTKAGVMSAADKTKLDSISNEWTGTQAEYDALATKDDNTTYYITD